MITIKRNGLVFECESADEAIALSTHFQNGQTHPITALPQENDAITPVDNGKTKTGSKGYTFRDPITGPGGQTMMKRYRKLFRVLVNAGANGYPVKAMSQKGLVRVSTDLGPIALWLKRVSEKVGKPMVTSVVVDGAKYWAVTPAFAKIYHKYHSQ